MKNILEIQKHKAVVSYDPEIGMFRGEFLGLSGGADFYGASLRELNKEGQKSLKIYLELCKEKGIEPYKSFSGRFNVRLSPEMHEAATLSAAAQNKSLNDWVSDALRDALVDEDLLEA